MPLLPSDESIRIESVDSALGRWELATWSPPDLAPAVEAMWYFDGWMDLPRERIFPQGRIELIVHLGEVYREVRSDGAAAYPLVCATGQQRRSLVIEAPPGRTSVLGIRLSPVGAYMLFGRPVDEVTDATVDLQHVAGPAAPELAERCAAAAGAANRLRVAGDWLRHRLAEALEPDAAVAWAAAAIDRGGGRVSIAQLRERTGWSRTRFTTKFREQVGVTPKTLARIARFRRALVALHSGTDSLSAIAHACGYYDHAHFTADFRDVCGFTPSDYRAALSYPNSVNLAVATG